MYFYEANIKIGHIEKDVLVVFSGQLEEDLLYYGYEFESHFSKIGQKPEEVFFVYPEYLHDKIDDIFCINEKAFENIIRFGSEIPVTKLSFDIRGELRSTALNKKSELCDDLILLRNVITQQGLLYLARKRKDNVILKAPSGSIFLKPSKQRYDEFLKASELAVGFSENQFVSFCLLNKAPKDRNIRNIYIDTNSISSFIEGVVFYWMKFNNSICKTASYHSPESVTPSARQRQIC